jgi:hypothetical protein
MMIWYCSPVFCWILRRGSRWSLRCLVYCSMRGGAACPLWAPPAAYRYYTCNWDLFLFLCLWLFCFIIVVVVVVVYVIIIISAFFMLFVYDYDDVVINVFIYVFLCIMYYVICLLLCLGTPKVSCTPSLLSSCSCLLESTVFYTFPR